MSIVRFVSRRPTTAGLSAAAFAVLVATPSPASAQEANSIPSIKRKHIESPQHFAVEIRFGAYKPGVDDDPALKGAKPYESAFGGLRWLLGLEIDWQVLRIPHFGSFGPGVSGSFTKMTAKPLIKNTDVVSAETTYLEVFPLAAMGVLRIDVLSNELKIPLVPYGKFGLAYALWNSSTGAGISRAGKDNERDARGATYGYQAALGVALHLNPFDLQTARNFDSAAGVNHTYFFFEGTWMTLTEPGVGQQAALRLSDRTWNAGLAFEF